MSIVLAPLHTDALAALTFPDLGFRLNARSWHGSAGHGTLNPVPLLLVGVLAVLAVIALMPLSLVMRYRVGTSRRRARGWVATINFAGFAISSGMFLTVAAITSAWVPGAFTYALTGLTTGSVLGLLGLWLTRWESAPGALHYTPNRWLILGITLVVAVRLAYGFWRAWQAWRAGVDDTTWVAASGVAGSMAAGAVVLGYYLVYWMGVRRRLRSLRR